MNKKQLDKEKQIKDNIILPMLVFLVLLITIFLSYAKIMTM